MESVICPDGYVIEYSVVKSSRRTLAVELKDGSVRVRAPFFTSKARVKEFLLKHARWIRNNQEKLSRLKASSDNAERLTPEELDALYAKAKAVLPERVRYYASLLHVRYGRITIRCQRTKWGSCSAKGNLNFNCLLMLCPENVRDSVVAHEVSHLLELNHSKRFYEVLYGIFPDYDACRRWLIQNGASLMARVPEAAPRN